MGHVYIASAIRQLLHNIPKMSTFYFDTRHRVPRRRIRLKSKDDFNSGEYRQHALKPCTDDDFPHQSTRYPGAVQFPSSVPSATVPLIVSLEAGIAVRVEIVSNRRPSTTNCMNDDAGMLPDFIEQRYGGDYARQCAFRMRPRIGWQRSGPEMPMAMSCAMIA